MSAGTNEKVGFLRQVDLLVLIGALVALFVALGSEPWWTLTGTTTNNLMNIQVSPFYLHINALVLSRLPSLPLSRPSSRPQLDQDHPRESLPSPECAAAERWHPRCLP